MANITLKTSCNGGTIRFGEQSNGSDVNLNNSSMPKYVGARATVTRTEEGVVIWMSDYVGETREVIDESALLESPVLTGTPTAPTAATGTSTTQIATTEFVANAVEASVSGVSDVEVAGTSVVSEGVANLINLDFGQGYGTCDTAQTDSAKTVTLDGFKAVDGAIVAVRFSNAVDKIYTLNVNSTGAYKVTKSGLTPSGASAADSFPELAAARSLAVFVLKRTTSGTMYHYLGASYRTASSTRNGLMTSDDKVKLDGIEDGAEANPTNVSVFANDAGYLTTFTETDPTVPSWAKASSKPSYTASEVGALPASTVIPSKTSDLTNDSGYITLADLPIYNGGVS